MNPSGEKYSGQRIVRREDDRLVRGEAIFSADVFPDQLLHIAFVRSSVANGRILNCDLGDARQQTGVVAVFTGEDVAQIGTLSVAAVIGQHVDVGFPILARDSVAAVGQPIVAVVAESASIAQDAIDGIYVDIDDQSGGDTQPPVFAGHWKSGDIDAAFATADCIVSATVRHPRLAPCPMEPRAITVDYDAARDSATVWLSTQTPHRARQELARMLAIDADRLRVVATDVGGAFGMKASLYPEEVLTVWAAFELRRSTQWVASRSEDFLSASHGRGGESRGELAVRADGTFLGLRASGSLPLGHWLPTSAGIPTWNAGRILPGAYRVAAVDTSMEARQSDTAAVGIYRGAGRPEAACLMERLVDEAAAATGIDPIDIRAMNLVQEQDLPFTTATGVVLDSGRYREALNRLAESVDYKELRARIETRRANGELVGIGVAFYVEPCGTGWESARVTCHPDGSIVAATGGSSQGHGRETAIAQIVADRLGVPLANVKVLHGDTATCPNGIGALASRSTAIGGSAMQLACDAVAEQIPGAEGPITEEFVYETPNEAWGYGCYVVTVAIDRDTGDLSIESAACIDDVGNVINASLVAGQILGGFAQGIGEAMLEELHYDESGQLLTGSLTDYALPRAGDIPPLKIVTQSTPCDSNEIGAKGIGEAGTIGAPAAILNAATDALRPLGVRDLRMPLSRLQIWQQLQGAAKGNTQ